MNNTKHRFFLETLGYAGLDGPADAEITIWALRDERPPYLLFREYLQTCPTKSTGGEYS